VLDLLKKGSFLKNPSLINLLMGNIMVAYRDDIILLKMLPTAGPKRVRTAITTIATKTRIKAYSTRP